MLDFSNIGVALRSLRRQAGLKQSELAESADITSPMLSAYETGKQNPSFATLDKILEALDCDAADLANALQTARTETTPREALLEGDKAGELDGRLDQLLRQRHRPSAINDDERAVLVRLLPGLLWLLRHLRSH